VLEHDDVVQGTEHAVELLEVMRVGGEFAADLAIDQPQQVPLLLDAAAPLMDARRRRMRDRLAPGAARGPMRSADGRRGIVNTYRQRAHLVEPFALFVQQPNRARARPVQLFCGSERATMHNEGMPQPCNGRCRQTLAIIVLQPVERLNDRSRLGERREQVPDLGKAAVGGSVFVSERGPHQQQHRAGLLDAAPRHADVLRVHRQDLDSALDLLVEQAACFPANPTTARQRKRHDRIPRLSHRWRRQRRRQQIDNQRRVHVDQHQRVADDSVLKFGG
jgi:hypothetical protein